MKNFQILFLIIVFFTIQAQADFMTDVYQFTNLTQNRALVKYDSHSPFLKKGHEVKPGECLYIHPNDFNHLSISLFIESSTLMFCDSNDIQPCRPYDYTLVSTNDLKQDIDNPTQLSTIEKNYRYRQSTPVTPYSEAQEFALVGTLQFIDTEECDYFFWVPHTVLLEFISKDSLKLLRNLKEELGDREEDIKDLRKWFPPNEYVELNSKKSY